MTAETKLAASGGVVPIRTSPAVGSDEEFDVLDALPQLIEGGMAATEHGAPILGELDAARIALQQTHAEGVLQFADRARDDGMGDGELARRLRHAPALRHREQDMQVAQLDPAPDPIVPAHWAPISKIANQMQDNSTFQLQRKASTLQTATCTRDASADDGGEHERETIRCPCCRRCASR